MVVGKSACAGRFRNKVRYAVISVVMVTSEFAVQSVAASRSLRSCLASAAARSSAPAARTCSIAP